LPEQLLHKQLHREPIGLLIAATRRRIKQIVLMRAGQFGLTPQQFWLVVGLAEGGSQSLHVLAQRARTDDPTASRVVQSLVTGGLVTSRPDPADRRRACLELTPRGQALGPKVVAVARDIRALVERELTPDERELVRAALRKILASLEAAA
jgi:DNA-binding MarR family transcriptional regulator